jgi:hypothetical protein
VGPAPLVQQKSHSLQPWTLASTNPTPPPTEPIRWFSKKEDDGQVERDLLPSFIGGVNWRLVVVTGSDSGAGTDADVLVSRGWQWVHTGPVLSVLLALGTVRPVAARARAPTRTCW